MGFPINTRSILLALVSVALSFPTPFAFLHITTNSLSTRQTLGQGINSSSNPPYQMYSILSTPTTITFLLSDPNPAAPTPDGGPGTPVRCSASFADKDGNTDMSQIPYDPQPCVDVVTGNAESASLFGWQAIDYRGPGLFVVRVWHGYLDKNAGLCAKQEDGTLTFCDTIFYGEHRVDVSAGDVICDHEAKSCKSSGVTEIPITGTIA